MTEARALAYGHGAHGYAARSELRHLGDVAAMVLKHLGTADLDVLGLGCGDGHKEVRLVQHLLAASEPPAVRLQVRDQHRPLLLQGWGLDDGASEW